MIWAAVAVYSVIMIVQIIKLLNCSRVHYKSSGKYIFRKRDSRVTHFAEKVKTMGDFLK